MFHKLGSNMENVVYTFELHNTTYKFSSIKSKFVLGHIDYIT